MSATKNLQVVLSVLYTIISWSVQSYEYPCDVQCQEHINNCIYSLILTQYHAEFMQINFWYYTQNF